jgi:biotin carboxyl carrier protein
MEYLHFDGSGKFQSMKNKENLKSLNINSTLYTTRISRKFENRKSYRPANPNLVVSFIPGTITEILVKEGQKVEKGEDLLVLDAMKMQNRLKSASQGKVKKINVSKGDRVSKGSVLIEIE